MATPEELVYDRLASDSALTTLIGDRLFPNIVPPHETPLPWVFYTVTEVTPLGTLGRTLTEKQSFSFDVLADTFADARAVATGIRDRLDGWTDRDQIQRVLWQRTANELTEDGFHQVVEVVVWYRTAPISVFSSAFSSAFA